MNPILENILLFLGGLTGIALIISFMFRVNIKGLSIEDNDALRGIFLLIFSLSIVYFLETRIICDDERIQWGMGIFLVLVFLFFFYLSHQKISQLGIIRKIWMSGLAASVMLAYPPAAIFYLGIETIKCL